MPSSLEVDLPCLKCGYNLRGLAGDPVTCPECGLVNPLGLRKIPEAVIRSRLRAMELPLAVSTIAATIAITSFCLVVACVVLNEFTRVVSVVCLGSPGMAASAAWIWGRLRFAKQCRQQRGFVGVFYGYHAWAMGIGALALAPVVLSICCIVWYNAVRAHYDEAAGLGFAIFLLTFVCAGGVFAGWRRWRRWMHECVEPMERETAVKMEREELRRRLSRGERA